LFRQVVRPGVALGFRPDDLNLDTLNLHHYSQVFRSGIQRGVHCKGAANRVLEVVDSVVKGVFITFFSAVAKGGV
jgi:hypothetical protein